LKVIILTMHDDPSYVRRAVELGASAYLLKSVDREELLRAIHAVWDGKSYIQGELSGPLIARMADPQAGQVGDLTLEEIQMLELLADGFDNRRLAAQLGLSEAAVKARLRAVYSTLGVSRRSEAVAIALRLGLIT
jgi:DNA-binding NarL/FixJ family response regulator